MVEKRSKPTVSTAQKKATKRYNSTHYDEIKIRLPKGQRKILKQKAEYYGISLNSYLSSCIALGEQIFTKN